QQGVDRGARGVAVGDIERDRFGATTIANDPSGDVFGARAVAVRVDDDVQAIIGELATDHAAEVAAAAGDEGAPLLLAVVHAESPACNITAARPSASNVSPWWMRNAYCQPLSLSISTSARQSSAPGRSSMRATCSSTPRSATSRPGFATPPDSRARRPPWTAIACAPYSHRWMARRHSPLRNGCAGSRWLWARTWILRASQASTSSHRHIAPWCGIKPRIPARSIMLPLIMLPLIMPSWIMLS